MLDVKLIREEPAKVRANLARRHRKELLDLFDELVHKDQRRLDVLKDVEELRRQRNVVTKEISNAKAAGKSIEVLAHRAKSIPGEIKEREERLAVFTDEIAVILGRLPNLLDPSVPEGKDDNENVVMRTVGKKPKFTFAPKGHQEILQDLGMLDVERATKVAGHGFYYLKGDAVLLDLALQRFALDFLRKKKFTLVEPPLMLNDATFRAVTDYETFHTQSYQIAGEDLRLIGTAEHPLGGMFCDEVLLRTDLPVTLAGVSPCFRKEVGAHGKYTKGLFRVHHFNKIEQFVFCHPQDSARWHEMLQKNSEALYRSLGIHFRVVNVCTGDIGDIAAKKYDIEAWMADGQYREAGSNSNCTDYQARNLGIKFREKEGQAPADYVHTLNNTAFSGRALIFLIEQYQRKDGTVKIPPALAKYTGFKVLGA